MEDGITIAVPNSTPQREVSSRRGLIPQLFTRLLASLIARFPWLTEALVPRIAVLESENRALEAQVAELRRSSIELEAIAVKDALTGLQRRDAFHDELSKMHNLLEREHLSCLSVVFLDLDHFKSINDTFGHAAGDKVLARVAQVIRDGKRDEDIVGRYGGEELVAALPGTDERGAQEFADRMCREIAELSFPFLNGRKVTASIGIATHSQKDARVLTCDDLVEAADQAMYRAKHGGRNRVCRATMDA